MKSFSDIVGQERAISFLKRAIGREKIPHAFLFTGTAGVGKSTTAVAFAQAINCLEPIENEGCGRCAMCRRMISGNFPDLLFIEPEGQNIKIGQIRELTRRMGYRPVAGNYRVTVIEQADLMNEEAANAFLKTLEEPPLGNILILETVEPRDLLSTIVSRCQKIPFQPLSSRIIKEFLMVEMKMDDERASLISRLSEGSLGRAINISEGSYMEQRKGHLEKVLMFPSITKEQVMDIAMEYADRYKKAKRENDRPFDIEVSELIGLWKNWYRDLMLVKVNAPSELLINTDFLPGLQSMSTDFTIDSLIECFSILDQAHKALRKNLNPGLMIEDTLLNLKRLGGEAGRMMTD